MVRVTKIRSWVLVVLVVLGVVGAPMAGADDPPIVGAQTTEPGAVRLQWWKVLGPNPPIGFTGNVAGCDAGTTSAAFRAAELRTLNGLRALAGVGPVTENTAWSAVAQQTAMLMAANDALDHEPPTSWDCYTSTAAQGAGTSNLFLGVDGPDAMTGYVADFGDGNEIVGHRRWVLCPGSTQMGFGDVPGGGSVAWSANALKVFGDSSVSDGPSRDGFVAWPYPGIVPLAYAQGLGLLDRFSIQVPTTLSTASASVTITSDQRGSIPVTSLVRDDNFYCQPAITWVPGTDPHTGETWTVTVSNLIPVADSSEPVTFTYDIQFSPLSIATPFVDATYTDFLGRAPGASERAFWQNRLDDGLLTGAFGSGRSELVDSLSHSSEWISHVLDEFYSETLGRAPDQGGLAYWTGALKSGRRSVASVAAAFYSSSEYYTNAGGTSATWIDALYQALLDRPADTIGRSYWIKATAKRGREAVAGTFYQSLESRRDRVRTLYDELLGRAPDSAGLAYWAGQVGRLGDLSLAANLAASNEYFERSLSRFP